MNGPGSRMHDLRHRPRHRHAGGPAGAIPPGADRGVVGHDRDAGVGRFEVTGDVRLYNADCLDILPALTGIDAVVTDPPYGVKARTTYKANGRSRLAECNDFAPVYGDDRPFDPSPWLGFSR